MIRIEQILDWFDRAPAVASTPELARRGPVTHVVILDGTMSTLDPGFETNAGILFNLLQEIRRPARLSLYYEPGLQWQGWKHAGSVAAGRGINRLIRRAYGFLASRYRPGDRIFLFGYSRGAYAVRSLAGLIDRMGLLRREEATERAVLLLYRHYQTNPDAAPARRLARRLCHPQVMIEMVGVWDTVKALGWQAPVLSRFTEVEHRFHDHQLGRTTRHGYQALALHETRVVFAPVLWESRSDWPGHVEQVWFRGTHGDVGGQLGGRLASRPLSNIALVWMLDRAEGCGLPLPPGWHRRFPQDASAPMSGRWEGWGKIFLHRRARQVGHDPSERLHHTVAPEPISPRWSPHAHR